MEFSKQNLSLEQAKEKDLVDYLSSLGFKPSKIRNNDYWYLSPLRNEKTPSFKVNRKLNRWYDHGIGEGGNLIDFGIRYHQCTIPELMKMLNGDFFFHKPRQPDLKKIVERNDNKIEVLGDFALKSFALLHYLERRGIPIELAEKYCREVNYEIRGKNYFGIGFKNDSDGWEIRNPFFKASSSPKDITTFKNGSEAISVFEGFTDFLSFNVSHENLPKSSQDFVVLNSVSFFERARPFMEQHQIIRLYLDRDAAGQNCSRRALSMSTKYTDESNFYTGYKDLNEWLVKQGQSQKRHLRQKLR